MIEQAAHTYDVFISYADADRAWVEGYLLDALTQAGVRCHQEAAFSLGVPRLVEFERAVQSSRYTLLILSPAYVADVALQFVDLLAQSFGLETTTWPVIPLILKPVELPPRLRMLQSLDATEPDQWPEVVERLAAALHVAVPGPAPRPGCPYPGLAAFDEASSSRFFGRDAEVAELVERLRLHPFTAVIGPSGSGKSSLVVAGLVPALRRSGLFGGGDWLVRVVRPGENPVATLRAALPKQRANDRRLLVIIDQFEEAFTLARGDMTPFYQAILALARAPACYVVVAMRADFYAELMATPLWKEVRAHRLEIAPLDAAGLRQAIVRPAEGLGVFVEGTLVERLVADAAGEPGILPLIQETLVLLWEHLERRFLPLSAYEALVLSFFAYQAMGDAKRTGLQIAMTRHADVALADLDDCQQPIARRIFLRLVQFGEGRADTRRQQPEAALRSARDEPGLFKKTLDHLAGSRLLTLSGEAGKDGRQVDIAHEALISGWPTLQVWLKERRGAEQTRRRLEAKAAEWLRLGGGSGGLLDDVELREAERWLASPDASDLGYDDSLTALLDASRKEIEAAKQREEAARQRELAQAQALAAEQKRRAEEHARSARRLRWLALGLTIVFVLAAAAAVVARVQTIKSEQLRLVSITQALAAQAAGQEERGNQDERGALLARQAYLFNQRNQGQALGQIDEALRAVLGAPYFSTVLNGHQGPVNGVAFSPECDSPPGANAERCDRLLASASDDGNVLLWHVNQPGSPPTVLAGHGSPVYAVAFSPDGQRLASGSHDGEVRLWDVRRPDVLPTVLREREAVAVFSVAFSPECDSPPEAKAEWCGRWLATGNADGVVRLWDVSDTSQPTAPAIHLRARPGDLDILSVAFSPECDSPPEAPAERCGRSLAAGAGDGSLWLWDVSDTSQPEPVPTLLEGHTKGVRSVAFSPDGRRLASGSLDESIRVWDLSQPQAEPLILRGHYGEVWSVAFSPACDSPPEAQAERCGTGQTLASASVDRTVRLWDLAHPDAPPTILRGHASGVRTVAFSPACDSPPEAQAERCGWMLASGGSNNEVRLWQMGRASAASIILYDRQPPVSLAFSPITPQGASGPTLASASGEAGAHLWDMRRPDADPLVLPDYGPAASVAFSPDGRTLALGTGGGDVVVWDAGQIDATPLVLRGHTDRVYGLAFSPECDSPPEAQAERCGQWLASGSWDGTIRVWNLRGQPGAVPSVLRGHAGYVWSVAFSPECDSPPEAPAERCGYTLASGGEDGTVRLWDVRQPNAAASAVLHAHQAGVLAVAFSPGGQTLASASADGTVRLWDMRRLEAEPITLPGQEDRAMALAFSPGCDSPPEAKAERCGQLLASGSADGAVRVWDLRRPDVPPVILPGHNSTVRAVAFSPGPACDSSPEAEAERCGQVLASSGEDSVIVLQMAHTDDLAAMVCQQVWRNLSREEWDAFVGADIPYERTCPNLPAGTGVAP